MKTVYLKNRDPTEKREVDPDTQCETILKPRKKRIGYSGFMRTIMMFSAMATPFFNSLYGDLLSPNLHKSRGSIGKDKTYYINLSRKDQKLPYETKQDLRKLKYHLKMMDQLSEYEIIIRYKFR
jgi:chromatin remodeling complex protein RSC6